MGRLVMGCKTDEEVPEGLLNVLPSHQFAFRRSWGWRMLWVTPKATPGQPTLGAAAMAASMGVEVPPAPFPAELAPVLRLMNTHLKKVHAALNNAATHCTGDIHGPFGSDSHVAFECAQERI